MSILTNLLILVLSARVLGASTKRLGLTALAGEIFAGVLLGPAVLNLIQIDPALSAIADLAIFLIILSAGLELDFKEIMGSFKGKALPVAIAAFVIPLLFGIGVGVGFNFDLLRSFFLGLCMAITALPVAIRILKEFDLLRSPLGRNAIVAAVTNDILALFALGVVLNLAADQGHEQIAFSIGLSVLKIIALGILIFILNFFLEKAEAHHFFSKRGPDKLGEFFGQDSILGMIILFVLAIGSISEFLGFHFIIGAFFAALLIDRRLFSTSHLVEAEKSLSWVSQGFFTPLFFAYLGLEFTFKEIPPASLVLTVLLVSIVSKVAVGWAGGKWLSLKGREPIGLGLIFNCRGIIELVFANIAYRKGLIGADLFSVLILMGAVTTLMTPLLFNSLVVTFKNRSSGSR